MPNTTFGKNEQSAVYVNLLSKFGSFTANKTKKHFVDKENIPPINKLANPIDSKAIVFTKRKHSTIATSVVEPPAKRAKPLDFAEIVSRAAKQAVAHAQKKSFRMLDNNVSVISPPKNTMVQLPLPLFDLSNQNSTPVNTAVIKKVLPVPRGPNVYNFITIPCASDPLELLQFVRRDECVGKQTVFDVVNGKKIPFYLLFQDVKDISPQVKFWRTYVSRDMTKKGKTGNFVRSWLRMNRENQWLNSTDAIRLLKASKIGSPITSSSWFKVAFPSPWYNYFPASGNRAIASPNQRIKTESIPRHIGTKKSQEQRGIPESAPHDMFYKSACKSVLPILERMRYQDDTYYRVHPIWLLCLKYKKSLGQPILGFPNVVCDIDFSKWHYTPRKDLSSSGNNTSFGPPAVQSVSSQSSLFGNPAVLGKFDQLHPIENSNLFDQPIDTQIYPFSDFNIPTTPTQPFSSSQIDQLLDFNNCEQGNNQFSQSLDNTEQFPSDQISSFNNNNNNNNPTQIFSNSQIDQFSVFNDDQFSQSLDTFQFSSDDTITPTPDFDFDLTNLPNIP